MMKFNEVPQIDCSRIAGSLEEVENTEAFKEFTQKLGDGMSQIGFVYFINHGVDSETIENYFAQSREFFKLPKDVKLKYKKTDPLENFQGYTADDENLGEVFKSATEHKECYDVWGLKAHDEANYPKEIPGLKQTIEAFRAPLNLLTKKILRSFAVYLKLDDVDFFINHHKNLDDNRIKTQTMLRTNYYGPLIGDKKEIGKDDMRLSAHNDWGSVTLLVQDDCGGLEAMKSNGEWIFVPPVKDSIVLNAGLMLEMWSGGLFPATAHRVRVLKDSAGKLRQSLVYFIQPDGDSICVPIVPEKPDWKPLYPKVEKETAFEYFSNRVRASRTY